MSPDYDTIVIGSGIAATLVVDRLLEANPLASILVLEAGKRIASRDRRSWWDLVINRQTPYSWTYDDDKITSASLESISTGNTPWGFEQSRVRAYGGSTMHWGGWALRYKEEDFNCRSRTGFGADWPFDYDELEPWYALAEQLIGVGGDAHDEGPKRSGEYPLPPFPFSANEREIADAFENFPIEDDRIKAGHMPIARFKRCMTTGTCRYCPIGSRYSAQDHMDAMLFNAAHRNLHLRTSCTVKRLIVERNHAKGVEFLDLTTGEIGTAFGQRIIVCAGAYESAKLLLASTSPEWPSGVGNRHDQVGRYVVTHLMINVEGVRPKNPHMLFQEYDFPTMMSRSWDTPEQQRDGKFFIFTNRGLPKIEFEKLMIEGKSREDIMKIAGGERKAGLSAFIEEFSEPDNRLTLAPGTGKFGLPKMRVHFSRRSPTQFNQLVATAQTKLEAYLESIGYKKLKTEPQNPRGDHTSGVCRMGISPDASVTNEHLAVHGFDNLFVCSNAVLPNAAAVNPTLTLAALALRLGTRLGGGAM
jgi:choline dehydrogenase-like flavoprotein